LAISSFFKALDMTFRWKMRWRSRQSTAKASAPSAAPTRAGLALAIAAPLAVTALKLALPSYLGHTTPFLLYFAAVLVGAWSGGLAGGISAVALSALLGSALFLPQLNWRTTIRPTVFVLEGLAITWLTARLQAEHARALRSARDARLLVAKVEGVLSSVHDGITVQEPSGKLIYANQQAAAMLGYPDAETLLAAPLDQVMDRFEMRTPEGAPFPSEELPGRKALSGEPAPEQLLRVRVLATGQEHWRLVRAAPVRLAAGEVLYAVNVFHDLTELRRRDEALRVSQAWFATALHSIGDAVIATDALGAVTFMNPRAEQLSGWPSAEATGKPLAQVFRTVDESTRATAQDPVERVLDEGKRASPPGYRLLITRDGRELAIDDSVAPLRSPEGQLLGTVLVFRDVTQKRSEEREIARARAQAEQASRAKDEFLAMLGHELRNPLAPIVTAIHLMKTAPEQPFTKEIGIIERQVRHMVTLVDDLLDVARVTSGKVQLLRERVELVSVVAKAAELAQPLIGERQHSLTLSLTEGLVVDGDPVRLAQVLANLLTNAAKYTPQRGRIELAAHATADHVLICVRDDGLGIEPELLPRLFEPFVQGRQPLDRAKGGLGLGLAIVRNLVELHGGRVSAHSDGPLSGSEFRVYLPRVDKRALPPAREHADAEPGAPRSSRARLLLVEDNAAALALLSQALRRLGHEVHIAEDAVAALSQAAMFQADVALLDIGLPIMDGYELATRLRAIPGWQRVKLVALTGYGQRSDKQRAAAAGFDEHLVKPVSLDTLSGVLSRLAAN
jgi:PAS domain S-box-containing protein